MCMKVLFLYSTSGREKYQKDYDLVETKLEEFPEIKVLTMGDSRKYKNHSYYKTLKRRIYEADALVIENTHQSFRLGHEATLAVMKKKPVLVLSQTEDLSEKIKLNFFFGAKYRRLTLEDTLSHFIKIARKKVLSRRLNLFISEEQEEFLQKSSRMMQTNKSEFIRSLIEEKLKTTDLKFEQTKQR